MHPVGIRQHVIDRVLARRGRHHLFDVLDPKRTAFVVIDMVNMFVEPGSAAEVAPSRGIVDNINSLNAELRSLGVTIVWITSPILTNGKTGAWNKFLDHFVADDVRMRTMDALKHGGEGQAIWPDLTVDGDDFIVEKNRYSALAVGTSGLERLLRSIGVDTVLIGGTKTNVCCESTARDAMQLDFDVVMVEDCCAALSDDEHRAALENVIQQFGDVMTSDEVLSVLRKRPNAE